MTDVEVRETRLTLPAYREPPYEKLPMFAENRVHQRSSGNPYPNPVVVCVDRAHREEKTYRCLVLENAYLRLEILPELGGRIYSALDKSTGYDFFYKQHAIKPALIGMLGSWISGGVEFNWPCHHRPSTFMPVDDCIEREENGAVTVWLSEHEPLNRMKGMVGIRLAPGEARFETRMRVYNRTQTRRSFLWWENAAVPVNEEYELFFPPDVHFVQFHYRKNVTSFPIARGVYNGIRMGEGVDIRLHRNTRQPTSYFSAGSHYDFFGGYDHGRQAGVVHVADPHVSVGKKMFTWAYGQLASSWERALTDEDGMYAELMAGSYSANQPDFAWLEPYEEKSFSQCWYPIGALGIPLCATLDAAVAVGEGEIRLQATRELVDASLDIRDKRYCIHAAPGEIVRFPFAGEVGELALCDAQGRTLLRYCPAEERPQAVPAPLAELPALDQLANAQDAYRAGVHVAQYRDPIRSPERYWQEALRFDAGHAETHQELSRHCYEHLRYEEALSHALSAWEAVTRYNFHPLSGDIPYLAGLALEALNRDAEAEDWHQKAAWAQDARSRAMVRLAMIAGRRKDYAAMERYARQALEAHAPNGTAAACLALALWRQGKAGEAKETLRHRLAHDPLDKLCGLLLVALEGRAAGAERTDAWQNALDLAEDLEQMGEREWAEELLAHALKPEVTAWPSRHGEYRRLSATGADDYGLACLLYARGHWARAAILWDTMGDDWRALRNLAVACYSHLERRGEALPLMQRALALAPQEEQLVWETAYLMARLALPCEQRLAFLDPYLAAGTREDILLESVRTLNQAGRMEKALDVLSGHAFTPCEGGEHAIAEQYMYAHHALGRRALAQKNPALALAHFQAAQKLPENLGSGLWNECLLAPHQFFEAECLDALGRREEANRLREAIVGLWIDGFSDMYLPELRCYQALCWARMGQAGRGEMMLREHIALYEQARKHRDAGWFQTTPFFVSFMEPAETLRGAACDWQLAMAHWARGERGEAAAWAGRALRGEPLLLYARLLMEEGLQ